MNPKTRGRVVCIHNVIFLDKRGEIVYNIHIGFAGVYIALPGEPKYTKKGGEKDGCNSCDTRRVC